MLFKPTFKLDIVSDKTYGSDMKQLEKNLEKYAHNGYFESFDQNKMFYE